jgi:predicted lipoprotein with Yx(FWY)xxD motif
VTIGRTRSIRTLAIVSIAALTFSACAKTATPSSGDGSAPTGGSITVGARSVSGIGTVLVDASGSTLYYLKTESAGTIKCTGSCADNWPPLVLPAGTTSATAGSGVDGSKLGTIARPDGSTQVTYSGMPLYAYVGDQGPGQTTGEGIADFFAVTIAGGGASSPSPTSPAGHGGGYGY